MAQEINFKAVVFVQGNNLEQGYFFYNSDHDSSNGHFFSVKNLTLKKAIAIMDANGLDPINNFKVNILVYYH